MADKPRFTRIEIYSEPDSLDRVHYAKFWMADYHPGHPEGEHRTAERGQHFFGVPPDDIPVTLKGNDQ